MTAANTMTDSLDPITVHVWRPRSTKDGLNARTHRKARAAHTARVRESFTGHMLWHRWPRELPDGLTRCRLTVQLSRGKLTDDDNVPAMCKPIRDAIAKWFGVDDGPSGPLTWEYVWRRGPDRTIVEVLK